MHVVTQMWELRFQSDPYTFVISQLLSLLGKQKGTLTLFFPIFPFDPPENIRKPKVIWCYQGNQRETLERKGLKLQTCKNGCFIHFDAFFAHHKDKGINSYLGKPYIGPYTSHLKYCWKHLKAFCFVFRENKRDNWPEIGHEIGKFQSNLLTARKGILLVKSLLVWIFFSGGTNLKKSRYLLIVDFRSVWNKGYSIWDST